MHHYTAPALGIMACGVVLDFVAHRSDQIDSLECLFFRFVANQKKSVVHACTTTVSGYATRCYSNQLWQYVETAWTVIPQGYIQSLFDSMTRRLAADIANNGGYTDH
ncbi:hypothetical protein TNCV_3070351 [Trichonephila clavipes]|nr:hypothetical protein TNCV_3070351 [Trichonephila clavipes]